jgi:hypothetical protein
MSSPNPTPHDAQRELEQRALRNVRGLVDKMDAIDRVDRAAEKRGFFALVAAGVLLVVVILGGMLYISSKYEAPPVKVDPAKLPPIRSGPPK